MACWSSPTNRLCIVVAAAGLSRGCVAGRPGPHSDGSPPAADVARTASPSPEVARTEHFVFHSRILLNLHHFLYQAAAASARREGVAVAGRPLEVTELDAIDALRGDERRVWSSAIAFYRREAIGRDLLFDDGMGALKRQIVAIEDPSGGWATPLDPKYAAVLLDVLPVYRDRFWAAHEQANRSWIAGVADQLAHHETALVGRMTAAYGGHWPAAPIRVDVCAYANWAGGYTSAAPPHIVVSSLDGDSQGSSALEVLFHEASHTSEMFDAFRAALAAAFAARGADEPRGLWHLFIFLSAGDAVQRTLAAAGVADYVHYGERSGVYARGPWASEYPALREHWLRHLAGEVDQPTTLARIVAIMQGGRTPASAP